MVNRPIPLIFGLFLLCLNSVDAATLYSRQNGDWQAGFITPTWSTTGHNGASCSCAPTSSDSVVIAAGDTVNMNFAGSARSVTVSGVLRWTSNVSLGITNSGFVTIDNGGLMDINGQTDANLNFSDASSTQLIVNTGGSISLEDLEMGAAGTLNISGGGNITLSDDINFNAANATLINNLSGIFNVNSSIAMRSSGGTFTNNDSIRVGLFLFFDDSNNVFNNGVNGVLNLSNDGIKVNTSTDDNNVINNSGTLYIFGDIEIADSEFRFNNSGVVDMHGEFRNFPSSGTRDIYNLAGATWSTTSTSSSDPDLRLFCNFTGNTFIFDSSGAQIMRMPQDAFWNLTLAGAGWKRPTASFDVNGNLTIESGAEFDPATNNVDITVAGNWINNGGTFTEGTRTITFDGTSVQSITGAETFYNLTINNSAAGVALTLNDPVNVNGTLMFTDGHISTSGANTITLGSSAAVTLNSSPQDSSFVKGPLRWTVATSASITRVFPVGKNNSYRRFDLTVDQDAATSTIYTGEMINSSADALGNTIPMTLNRVSEVRYWEISKGAGAGIDDAQVTLYYGTDDLVSDAANLAVVKDDGGGNWLDLSGTAMGVPTGSITSGSFTSFSDFTLANKTGGGNPLPISWLDFNAAAVKNSVGKSVVALDWSTGSEVNNDYFTVERSKDGVDFTSIGFVSGKGNTNVFSQYAFKDEYPLEGIAYYRIRQTDFDGTFTSSTIRTVHIGNSLFFRVLPNPVSETMYIQFSNYSHVKLVNVTISDLSGRELMTVSADPHQRLSLDVSQLAKGTYLLRVEDGNSVETKKWIKSE